MSNHIYVVLEKQKVSKDKYRFDTSCTIHHV